MIRISFLNRFGIVGRERTLKVPFYSKLESNNCNLHTFHNSFKQTLGQILGTKTNTVESNTPFIQELLHWKDEYSISTKNVDSIERFVKINHRFKPTTVFFENHWKYRTIMTQVPLLYLNYRLAAADLEVLTVMMWIHLCILGTLPLGEGNSLVDLADLRKTLNIAMKTDKTINQPKQPMQTNSVAEQPMQANPMAKPSKQPPKNPNKTKKHENDINDIWKLNK